MVAAMVERQAETARPVAVVASPWERVHCRYCNAYQKIDVQPPPEAKPHALTLISFTCCRCHRNQQMRIAAGVVGVD